MIKFLRSQDGGSPSFLLHRLKTMVILEILSYSELFKLEKEKLESFVLKFIYDVHNYHCLCSDSLITYHL